MPWTHWPRGSNVLKVMPISSPKAIPGARRSSFWRGWAAGTGSWRMDGGRFLGYIILGDLSDLYGFLCRTIDHFICALVPTQIAPVMRETASQITEDHRRVAALCA